MDKVVIFDNLSILAMTQSQNKKIANNLKLNVTKNIDFINGI